MAGPSPRDLVPSPNTTQKHTLNLPLEAARDSILHLLSVVGGEVKAARAALSAVGGAVACQLALCYENGKRESSALEMVSGTRCMQLRTSLARANRGIQNNTQGHANVNVRNFTTSWCGEGTAVLLNSLCSLPPLSL